MPGGSMGSRGRSSGVVFSGRRGIPGLFRIRPNPAGANRWALTIFFLLTAGSCPAYPAEEFQWGGSLTLGWDHNVLGSSYAEERAFHSDEPGYWFEVDHLEEWRGDATLWFRLDVPSFYRELRVKAEYERRQPVGNEVLAGDTYELSLRQKLPDKSRLELEVAYSPQVYLRHRHDKDAAPGEPIFRPEAYRDIEIELQHQRSLLGQSVILFAGHEIRDETRWFDERDRWKWLGGLSWELPSIRGLTLEPRYEGSWTWSRNEPDLGSDLSYREHAVGLRISAAPPLPGGAWKAEAGGELGFREYTTTDPDDQSRFHRNDQAFWWNVKLGRPMGKVMPFVLVEAAGRRVDLPGGVDEDEDGEYDRSLVRLGVEWES